MLFVISPAKSLDFENAALSDQYSEPTFLEDTMELVEQMRAFEAKDIVSLMGVSYAIAELNVDRYRDFELPFNPQNAKQAVYAFTGDVYTGLSVSTAGEAQISYLQTHARILSGLYGVLKPLDLMQPYRLEMGIKLKNQRGDNLYQFWGLKVTDLLNEALAKEEESVLVNLASNEYFKSVQKKHLNARIVTPVFKDLKNDQYKIISFYAKKARGMMLRYAADNQIQQVEDLKGFNVDGYRFNAGLSEGDSWCFTRDQAPG